MADTFAPAFFGAAISDAAGIIVRIGNNWESLTPEERDSHPPLLDFIYKLCEEARAVFAKLRQRGENVILLYREIEDLAESIGIYMDDLRAYARGDAMNETTLMLVNAI